MANILYSFRRCPYAMRARLALKISGAEYEHREVLLRDKPAEMLEASPKATVPIIVQDDGTVIEESFDIMLWALADHDPESWMAPGLENMQNLIATIEGPFANHQFRYKYASHFHKGADRKTVDHEQRALACEILANYESILAKSPYLMGAAPSLADYAIFPFIRQFAAVEPEWWAAPQFPHLKTWLDGFLESELFASVMHKIPLWKAE